MTSASTPAPARSAGSLILEHRWAALGTIGTDGPTVSHVAYAPEGGFGGLLLFLSALSTHTRHVLADPRASLGITEGDPATAIRRHWFESASRVPSS